MTTPDDSSSASLQQLSPRSARKQSRSEVPGIGYPVPLAIATIALSIVGYFFALFV